MDGIGNWRAPARSVFNAAQIKAITFSLQNPNQPYRTPELRISRSYRCTDAQVQRLVSSSFSSYPHFWRRYLRTKERSWRFTWVVFKIVVINFKQGLFIQDFGMVISAELIWMVQKKYPYCHMDYVGSQCVKWIRAASMRETLQHSTGTREVSWFSTVLNEMQPFALNDQAFLSWAQ